ncbi:MAG: DNA polymerase III subunit delta [bacterium]
MAKAQFKYLISYKNLLDTLQKEPIANNILISLKEKVLSDDLIRIISEKFVGKFFDAAVHLIIFNAEDKPIENLLNECSNTGLFTQRKVVVLRNVKKLLKEAKTALLEYLKRSNPDTCLIMISNEEKFEVEKIFLSDGKEKDESGAAKESKGIIDSNVKIYEVSEFTDADKINWIEKKFEGYKISKDTIMQFLQFTNNSLDEILSEIEKLKTYCYFSKEVTTDSVNMCNGIAKDFDETDFIKAILEHQSDKALKIYSQISLKKDVEVFLIFLLSSAFIIINKLFDPAAKKLEGFQLKRELKLWFPDQEKLLPYYRNFGNSIKQEKIKTAFEYIYATDKIFKTSAGDKRTTMTVLITNICNL